MNDILDILLFSIAYQSHATSPFRRPCRPLGDKARITPFWQPCHHDLVKLALLRTPEATLNDQTQLSCPPW
ncbi:hypothetical protein LshimejAT787_0406810 [Lyophyllum shimeji]|uniref:Uncharacterized protein n=1 Tax=Lyophyllum shimeji TaxID=47721 RepID=A0A9P3UNA4_LYOSH|nr:hypothetical protein LshimejAT787_0406810 [Lyophyllum shimeji]